MNKPFKSPPRLRDLGAEVGQSYWAIRRLVQSGVAPTVSFPDGLHIRTDWANDYCQHGLTADEMRLYRTYMKHSRSQHAQ